MRAWSRLVWLFDLFFLEAAILKKTLECRKSAFKSVLNNTCGMLYTGAEKKYFFFWKTLDTLNDISYNPRTLK
jgi:hypothetical protein